MKIQFQRFVVLLIMVLFAYPAAAGPSKRPIIDAHGHAFHLSYFDDIGWPDNHWTGEPTPKYTNESLMKATIAALDKYNIVKVVLSGKPDLVQMWLEAAPERVIPATLTGGPYDIPIDELRRDFKAGKYKVMGEMFSQYYGLEFTDPKVTPYFALADELDVPAGIHTGLSDPDEIKDGGYTKFRARLGNPIDLEEVLVEHPDLRLYLMHAGTPFEQETRAIMHMYRNVYLDVASIAHPHPGFHEMLRRYVVEAGLGKRILFGTDFYLWPDDQIRNTIESIESADFLTDEQKDDIFCKNAARFFRLEMALCE